MRLIDADGIGEEFREYRFDGGKYSGCSIGDLIDAQPTVNQWIPTSVKLPEKDGLYRVTIHPDYLTPQMVQTDDFYWENGKWKFWEVEHLKLVLHEVDVEVIAWKPLEEPYREEQQDVND